MPALYRVLPHLPRVAAGRPGSPRHVPPSTGANRVDNPDLYAVLYLGDSPVGAVAEAFGWAPRWSAALLRGSPSLPGSTRALVTFELPASAPLCDLDDAARLVDLRLRPSEVVTRDRGVTQAWSRRIFETSAYAGVRWWSYYEPSWGSVGLWDVTSLAVTAVEPLTVDHPALVAAAETIVRVVER